jgi:hypothetical protein
MPTKTKTRHGQSISTKQQRFAVKSVTRFTQISKVSLLACSRASSVGYVRHRSGCRKTKLVRLASHSCAGYSSQTSCNRKFSGTVSPSVSKAIPHTAACDA